MNPTEILYNGALAVVVVALFYSIAVFVVRKWRLRAFPGPFAIPIVGNLWDPEAPKVIAYLRKQSKVSVHCNVSFFTNGKWPLSFTYTPFSHQPRGPYRSTARCLPFGPA